MISGVPTTRVRVTLYDFVLFIAILYDLGAFRITTYYSMSVIVGEGLDAAPARQLEDPGSNPRFLFIYI